MIIYFMELLDSTSTSTTAAELADYVLQNVSTPENYHFFTKYCIIT